MLLDTIAPTISCTLSVFRETSPELTVKSVESNEAIPLLEAVASSALIVTDALSLPDPETSIPSPALIS